MPTVTLSFLRRQLEPACQNAQNAFLVRYPSGVAPLHEVVAALAEHPQGAGWFEWLMDCHADLEPFKATYYEVARAALVAYDWAVHAARIDDREAERFNWCAYLKAVRAAKVAYQKALRPAIRDIARQLAEQAATGKEE